MSAFNGAHSVRGGFNQSGGSYFVCVTALCSASGQGVTPVTALPLVNTGASTDSTYLYKLTAASSNSGGAFVAPTLAPLSAQELFGVAVGRADEAAVELTAGKLIRDMGKTVVSGGRTFRKFAIAGAGANYVASLGVAGAPATAPGAGYATFYLDVGREGATGTTLPAPIARYV